MRVHKFRFKISPISSLASANYKLCDQPTNEIFLKAVEFEFLSNSSRCEIFQNVINCLRFFKPLTNAIRNGKHSPRFVHLPKREIHELR